MARGEILVSPKWIDKIIATRMIIERLIQFVLSGRCRRNMVVREESCIMWMYSLKRC